MTQRKRVIDSVHDWLLTQLSSRQFRRGDALHAPQIGERLGVSESTVRRAVERLIEDGWVRRTASGRVLIAALPPKKNHPPADFVAGRNHVDVARLAIQEKVFRGELKMGETINATGLADELGVSLPALRQALEGATHTGIVDRQPHRGWRVVQLTAADIRDICRIRLRLEPMVIKHAIRRMTDAVIDQLAAESRALEDSERSSQAEMRRADYRFHRALFDVAGRPVLTDTLDSLIQKLFLHPPVRGSSITFTEHLAILDAIRERNEELAIERLRRHLQGSARSYVAAAREREKLASLLFIDGRPEAGIGSASVVNGNPPGRGT